MENKVLICCWVSCFGKLHCGCVVFIVSVVSRSVPVSKNSCRDRLNVGRCLIVVSSYGRMFQIVTARDVECGVLSVCRSVFLVV